jgi:chromosome partitioning protein
VTGYFVTTNTFNESALAEASRGRRIWPIDGEHLVRYITYIRGTRAELSCDTENDPRLRRIPPAPVPPDVFLAADNIDFRSTHNTKVLALANHKGGVGKTTSALNIALGLAAQDQQVLLVDMDPQANLTSELPPQAPGATPAFIDDYFTGKRQLASLIRQTQFPRVWPLPSVNALTRSDEGIAAGPATELRFARDLHAPDIVPPQNLDARPFDWIIIDTGPSIGHLTRSALAASHGVLVPVAPEMFADLGAHILKETVGTVQALVGKPIDILGFLITKWRENALNNSLVTSFTNEVVPKGWTILKARIPLDEANITRAHNEVAAPRTILSGSAGSAGSVGSAAPVIGFSRLVFPCAGS